MVYLRCSDLVYAYDGVSNPVINGVTLTIEQPGLHALFGPSGVGKSSLAKLLAGLIAPQRGTVDVTGPALYTHNLERLPDWSSVGRHMQRITPPEQTALLNSLGEAFGLETLLRARYSELSLGQQNRINLMRYLVQAFKVLIMDESLANVDERTRGTILETLKFHFPDAIFLYISHNAMEVATFCDQIWVLRDGRRKTQMTRRNGLNRMANQALDRSALDRSILEIMSVD